MTRRALPLLLLLVTACGGETRPEPAGPPAAAPAASSAASAAAAGPQVLATGLEAPWGIDFLPDGDALVTERDEARVLRIPAAGGDPAVVREVAEAEPAGEGGLLGLAVSPTYATDGRVFLYVTTGRDNRIVSFSMTRPDAPLVPVLTGIPKGTIHNGGRLAIGPEGDLWAGTGDVGERSLAQDPDSLGGKVLRMTLDGNPVAGADSLVFSRGHRNVQGLAFDDSGQAYSVEFGQNRFDEVNRISQGSNGGWPEVEGADDGGGRYLMPITTWETSEASPSGAAVVGDTLYVAALRGQRLWTVPLADPGSPVARYEGEYGRLRAAAAAPDGSLWVLTSNRDGRGDPVREDDRVLRLPVG
ncbi:MAG: glucose sorbosone dehydrogenase [Frankiales bacterium]|nr:glucose sorbosone dehydrogenase [Frankiales bacterium]